MLQVRKITPSDIESLLNIFNKCKYKTNTVLANIEAFMVCECDKEICALGCYKIIEDRCYINWVLVLEEYRRKSIGSTIIKAILNSAELIGAKEAFIAGQCSQFLSMLKFIKVEEELEIVRLKQIYKAFYEDNFIECFYNVSLIDYFVPCGK